MRKLILTFDIKTKDFALRKRVWRMLKKINAKPKFKSHWELDYSKENLGHLKKICQEIKRNSGEAELIVGEKLV